MSSSVWFLSVSKKKIEFKQYPAKKSRKKTIKKKKKKAITGLFFVLLVLFSAFITAAAIENDLHLNIQVTHSNGTIIPSTSFDFAFNISTSLTCSPVIYSNLTTITTDTRGIISYYLPDVNLSYDVQYWLCYYRDGVLINNSKIARVPYSFTAKNISAEGVKNDSNLDLTNYNVTADWGLFNFLGSLASRITGLFAIDVDISNNLTVGGNLSVGTDTLFVDSNLGRVGIGTGSPSRTFEVVGEARITKSGGVGGDSILEIIAGETSGESQLRFGDTDLDVGQIMYDHATDKMSFRTNAVSDRMVIDSSGNVGIGTSSPAYLLETAKGTENAVNLSGLLYINDSSSVVDIGAIGSDVPYLFNTADANSRLLRISSPTSYSGDYGISARRTVDNNIGFDLWYDTSASALFLDSLWNNDATIIQFRTKLAGGPGNIVEVMTLKGDGNVSIDGTTFNVDAVSDRVGIGTSSPGHTLTVKSGATGGADVNLSNTLFVNGSNVGIGTGSPGAIIPDGSTSPRILKIQSISTVTDSALLLRRSDDVVGLDIWSDGAGTDYLSYFDNRYEGSDFVWRTSTRLTPVERMRITADGKVGIGTANPREKLDVAGNIRLNGALLINISGTERVKLLQGGLEFYESNAYFKNTFTNDYISMGSTEEMSFYMGDAAKMRLHSSGGLALGDSYYSTDPGTDNMIIEGSLGIGTNTSQNTLNVVGDANVTGNVSADAFKLSSTEYISSDATNELSLHFNDSDVGATFTSGTNPLLTIKRLSAANPNYAIVDFTGAGTYFKSAGNNIWTFSGSSVTFLGAAWIWNSGYTRHNDNIYSYFGTGADSRMYYDGSNLIIDPDLVGLGEVYIDGGLVVNNTLYVNRATSNVGIGTSTPQNLLNVDGDANVTGTLYYGTLDGEADLNVNDSDYLDSYDSTFFMPLNTTVYGAFNFDGDWQSGGVTIDEGDIFAQALYVYSIYGLNVSDLNINGSLLPAIGFDNTFDIGNATLRWRDIYLGGQVYSNGTGDNYFLGNVGIGTSSPGAKLEVLGGNIALREDDDGNDAVLLSADNTDGGFRLYSSGVEKVKFGSASDSYFLGGNVGIGTSSPNVPLDVEGALRLNRPDNTEYVDIFSMGAMYFDNNASWIFRDQQATPVTHFIIHNSGDVGIGDIATPGAKLDITGDSADIFVRQADDKYSAVLGSDGAGQGYLNIFQDNVDADFADAVISISGVAGTNSWINVANFGIGTSSPAEDLHIEDGYADLLINATTDNAGIHIRNPVDEYGSLIYYHGATNLWNIGTLANDARLAFRQAGATEVMTLEEDGDVGIGVTAPATNLEIKDASSDTAVRISTIATGQARLEFAEVGSTGWSIGERGGDDYFYISNSLDNLATTARMVIDTSGQVGIGTTNPLDELSVVGTVNATDFQCASGTACINSGELELLKDIVAGTGLSDGANDVLPGADSDVTINLEMLGDLIQGTGITITGGGNDVIAGEDRDITVASTLGTSIAIGEIDFDHDDLGGLGDDDHPQYFALAQAETVTAIPAFNGGTTGSTAPFTVDSTYVVANLNADLLDGKNALPIQVAGTLDVDSTPGYSQLYVGSTSSWTNRGPANNNADALFSLNTHSGDYYSQLWFDTGADDFYHRSKNAGAWTSWDLVYDAGNDPLDTIAEWQTLCSGCAGADELATNSVDADELVYDTGQHLTTTSNVDFGDIYASGGDVDVASGNNYCKYGMWGEGDTLYCIGMYSAQTYGGLGDYAMTFTMNPDADRGFLWRDSDDAASDGAMSLTTGGILTVKSDTTIGGDLIVGADLDVGDEIIFGTSNYGFLRAESTNYVSWAANAYISGSWYYRNTDEAALIELDNGNIRFFTAPSGTAGTVPSWSQHLTILNSGQVGIGTTTMTAGRDLTVYDVGADQVAGEVSGAGAGTFWDINNNAVDGDPGIRFLLSGTTQFAMGVDDSQSDRFEISTSSLLSNGYDAIAIDNVGNVYMSALGISGMNTNICAIATTGELIEVASTTCGVSAIRFKNDIVNLTYGLKEILQLKPVSFTYKNYNASEFTGRTKKRVGFTAEDMYLVAPEIVVLGEDNLPYTIDYPEMVPLLTKAIQEQQVMIGNNTLDIKKLNLTLGELKLNISKIGLNISNLGLEVDENTLEITQLKAENQEIKAELNDIKKQIEEIKENGVIVNNNTDNDSGDNDSITIDEVNNNSELAEEPTLNLFKAIMSLFQ